MENIRKQCFLVLVVLRGCLCEVSYLTLMGRLIQLKYLSSQLAYMPTLKY